MKKFTLLHTSDFHMGHTLYEKKRYHEFEAFFEWLVNLISERKPDALLIAGDVFHNAFPSGKIQKMYFDLLAEVQKAGCRNIVVTCGNHDSASLIDAPGPLFNALNIYTVGSARNNPADEVFILKNSNGEDGAIVCAVPFLTEKDLRFSEAGESEEQKQKKFIKGIKSHFNAVGEYAAKINKKNLPIIGMGHLYTAGNSDESDGRSMGCARRVGGGLFPSLFDYTALGHIHIPMRVNNNDFVRYSGSPLPLRLDDPDYHKQVLWVEFQDRVPSVESIPIPIFQNVARLKGSLDDILNELTVLKSQGKSTWVDVVVESHEPPALVAATIQEAAIDSCVEVMAIHPCISRERLQFHTDIREITPEDVFEKLLLENECSDDDSKELMNTFKEALSHYEEAEE